MPNHARGNDRNDSLTDELETDDESVPKKLDYSTASSKSNLSRRSKNRSLTDEGSFSELKDGEKSIDDNDDELESDQEQQDDFELIQNRNGKGKSTLEEENEADIESDTEIEEEGNEESRSESVDEDVRESDEEIIPAEKKMKKVMKPMKPMKKKTKKKYKNPTLAKMINDILVHEQHSRKGISIHFIKKYMTACYNMTERAMNSVNAAVMRGVATGEIIRVSGKGATGSFKLPKPKPQPKPKPKPKNKTTVRKPPIKNTIRAKKLSGKANEKYTATETVKKVPKGSQATKPPGKKLGKTDSSNAKTAAIKISKSKLKFFKSPGSADKVSVSSRPAVKTTTKQTTKSPAKLPAKSPAKEVRKQVAKTSKLVSETSQNAQAKYGFKNSSNKTSKEPTSKSPSRSNSATRTDSKAAKSTQSNAKSHPKSPVRLTANNKAKPRAKPVPKPSGSDDDSPIISNQPRMRSRR